MFINKYPTHIKQNSAGAIHRFIVEATSVFVHTEGIFVMQYHL